MAVRTGVGDGEGGVVVGVLVGFRDMYKDGGKLRKGDGRYVGLIDGDVVGFVVDA